jgi:hypothetical protein
MGSKVYLYLYYINNQTFKIMKNQEIYELQDYMDGISSPYGNYSNLSLKHAILICQGNSNFNEYNEEELEEYLKSLEIGAYRMRGSRWSETKVTKSIGESKSPY